MLRREGAVVARATVRLEPGQERYTVPLSFVPDTTGDLRLHRGGARLPGRGGGREQRPLLRPARHPRPRARAPRGGAAELGRALPAQAPQAGPERRPRSRFFILRIQHGPSRARSTSSRSSPSPSQEIFGEQLRTFDAVALRELRRTRPTAALDIERFLPNAPRLRAGTAAGSPWSAASRASATRATERRALAEVLPVERPTGAGIAEGAVRPRLTAEAAATRSTSLAPGDEPNEAAWARCRRCTAVNLHPRARRRAAARAVLLDAPAVRSDGRPAPLVAVREVGAGADARGHHRRARGTGASSRRSGQGNRARLPALLEQRAPLAGARSRPRAGRRSSRTTRRSSRASRSACRSPCARRTRARGRGGGRRPSSSDEDGKRSVARGQAVAGAGRHGAPRAHAAGPGRVQGRRDGRRARHGPALRCAGDRATGAVAVRGPGPEDADAAPRRSCSRPSRRRPAAPSPRPGGACPAGRLAEPRGRRDGPPQGPSQSGIAAGTSPPWPTLSRGVGPPAPLGLLVARASGRSFGDHRPLSFDWGRRMKIAKGSWSSVDYSLHLGDGKVVDASEPGEPLPYIHGEGQIVPGLERRARGPRRRATQASRGRRRRRATASTTRAGSRRSRGRLPARHGAGGRDGADGRRGRTASRCRSRSAR